MKICKALLAVASLSVATPALADVVCEYPNACKQILNAGFSSGGDYTMTIYVGMTCVHEDGSVAIYNYKLANLSGTFGLNSFTIPSKIQFVKNNTDKMVCK